MTLKVLHDLYSVPPSKNNRSWWIMRLAGEFVIGSVLLRNFVMNIVRVRGAFQKKISQIVEKVHKGGGVTSKINRSWCNMRLAGEFVIGSVLLKNFVMNIVRVTSNVL